MTEDRVALSGALSLRRYVVSDRRRQQAVRWVGLVGVAVAVLLALNSRWLAAAACGTASVGLLWLSGLWVVPWSRDGYVRRVMGAWNTWATGAQWAYDLFSYRRVKLDSRLDKLRPPPGFATHHAELVGIAAESERLNTDRSAPFPELCGHVASASQAVDRMRDALASQATTDAERRYVAGLTELVDRRRAKYDDAAAKAERSTREAVRKLGRIRPPAGVAAEHDELTRAFERYLDAATEFHAACQSHEPARVTAGATHIEIAQGDLRASYEAIVARLDYATRWPMTRAEASSGD